MSDDEEVILGLNWKGVLLFVPLAFLCVPICWLPFLFDTFRAKEQSADGDPQSE